MKKRNLFLVPVLGLVLAGCGPTPQPEPPEPCSHVDANFDGVCDLCSETIGEPHTTHVDANTDGKCDVCGADVPLPMKHQDNFVIEIASPSVTRDFDERFDNMVEDFTGSTLNGTTEASVEEAKLRVLVDSTAENPPKSDDASIYKMATGIYALESYDEIGFKIRMTGNKELKLSNLVLALRGDDAWKTYPIKLSEAKDIDGEALPALSEEFKEFRIAPSQSIEDGNTEYDLANGTAKSGTKVLDKILGFHLHCLDEECSAVLEIAEVFITKAGEKTVLDNFNRNSVNKTDSTVWWRDSRGFIVRKGINVNGKTYTTPALDGKNAVVLSVMGDTTGMKLTTGNTTVEWANLKDTENAAVSNAVNGAYYPLVIDLEKSGLAKDASLKIESTKDVMLSAIYTTNLEVPQPVKEYPTFDVNTMAIYDNFNRTQSGFNGDYDSAIANQSTIDAGLVYQLSYNNGDKATISDGALHLDGTGVNYVNYKVYNSNVNFADYKYLIMAVKVENTTLNDFRVNIGGAGVTYWNQWKSGEGLNAANVGQEGYPYVKNGYTWVIIDFEKTGLTSFTDSTLDYYFTGEGTLSVDFVGLANPVTTQYDEEVVITKQYAADKDYDYAGYVYAASGVQYMTVLVEAENADATIDVARFEVADSGNPAMWFHEGNIKDPEGNVISGDTKVGNKVTIDLVASGMKADVNDAIGIHVHGGATGASATTITVKTIENIPQLNDVSLFSKNDIDLSGYAYVGGVETLGCKVIKVTFKSNDAGVTLKSFRFQGDAEKWFKDDAVIGTDGNPISGDTEVTSEGVTVSIDLEASGFLHVILQINLGKVSNGILVLFTGSGSRQRDDAENLLQGFKGSVDIGGVVFCLNIDC